MRAAGSDIIDAHHMERSSGLAPSCTCTLAGDALGLRARALDGSATEVKGSQLVLGVRIRCMGAYGRTSGRAW